MAYNMIKARKVPRQEGKKIIIIMVKISIMRHNCNRVGSAIEKGYTYKNIPRKNHSIEEEKKFDIKD